MSMPSLFKSPESRAVYSRLIDEVSKLGAYDQETKKTCVHLSNGRAFLGVHPRANGVLLTIPSDAPIESPRVRKVERTSARRYHNDLLLEAPGEVDAELLGWVRLAYDLTKKQAETRS
jgi:hypothetical protein